MNLPSTAFSWNARDFIKGAILAVIAPALLAIQQGLTNPPINWKEIGAASISVFIGYLIKNYFSNDVPAAQKTLFNAQQKLIAKNE